VRYSASGQARLGTAQRNHLVSALLVRYSTPYQKTLLCSRPAPWRQCIFALSDHHSCRLSNLVRFVRSWESLSNLLSHHIASAIHSAVHDFGEPKRPSIAAGFCCEETRELLGVQAHSGRIEGPSPTARYLPFIGLQESRGTFTTLNHPCMLHRRPRTRFASPAISPHQPKHLCYFCRPSA